MQNFLDFVQRHECMVTMVRTSAPPICSLQPHSRPAVQFDARAVLCCVWLCNRTNSPPQTTKPRPTPETPAKARPMYRGLHRLKHASSLFLAFLSCTYLLHWQQALHLKGSTSHDCTSQAREMVYLFQTCHTQRHRSSPTSYHIAPSITVSRG
jgi:hypothetical protein